MISLAGILMAATPFTNASAENINIYGWQNWSYEWVDADRVQREDDNPDGNLVDRDIDRLSNNAANIGFMSHMDTGIDGLQVGFRCEQFTYWGRNNHATNWCNRNSKISLRHETMGEIMFGQWLLPYNEIVAQWVDPFYDAGADSHTSIMGNIGIAAGGASLFYNGSFGAPFDGGTYGYLSFNRRQEGVVQYVWPNTSAMASQSREGFQFRAALTQGSGTDDETTQGNLDPRIFSTGVAYQHNMTGGHQIWLALAYEYHEDLSAKFEEGSDSEDEGYRIAGRYKFDWGTGQSTWIAAMYEELDYDLEGVNITGTGFDTLLGTNEAGFDIDRDAWMISGKHAFGNGLDFRFSYMDADEIECDDCGGLSGTLVDTDADAFNVGVFYTMPAGTELRATYSEVSNEDNAQYDFGINGSGVGAGGDVEMFAVGIVHWFD